MRLLILLLLTGPAVAGDFLALVHDGTTGKIYSTSRIPVPTASVAGSDTITGAVVTLIPNGDTPEGFTKGHEIQFDFISGVFVRRAPASLATQRLAEAKAGAVGELISLQMQKAAIVAELAATPGDQELIDRRNALILRIAALREMRSR